MAPRSNGETTSNSSEAEIPGQSLSTVGGVDEPHPAATAPFRLHGLKCPPNNLPYRLTSFVGRQREIASIQRLLSPLASREEQEERASEVKVRLLTLTGPGGCGKTRLAIEAAEGLVKEFPDGVCWTELADFSDPALVPQAVASTMGLREQPGSPLVETLSEALRFRQILLVFDNCEHLLLACGHLSLALLQACPNLSLLVTSRAALNVAGEMDWSVPPLAIPDLQQLFLNETDPISQLNQSESVRLFVDRASAVLPGFTLTEQNFAAIAQICHNLDGIPLAIELAAARVKVLTAQQIASRLDHLFRLLTRGGETALPRHQTLQATVDWSYDLLSEKGRILLRRLSVFAGTFSLTAAESVCAGKGLDEEEILDALADLVDQSLVLVSEREPLEEARYRLLEMIRQYGQEKLEEAGEAEWVLKQFLAFFLRLAEEAEPKLQGAEQLIWLRRLDVECANLREALKKYTTDQDPAPELQPQMAESGLRLAGALWLFWEIRGFLTEGRGWLERALARSGDAPAWTRAKALSGLGTIASDQGDFPKATACHQKALDLYQVLEDRAGIAFTLNNLGCHADRQGDYEQAMSLLEESLTLYQELGDTGGMTMALNNLGLTARDRGDRQRASDFYEKGLALARELGDKRFIAVLLFNLGELAHDQGDHAQTIARCEEALPLFQELGDRLSPAYIMRILGDTAQSQGDLKWAATLFRESLRLCQELGDKHGLAESLKGLAKITGMGGNPNTAAQLFSAAEALLRAIDEQLPPTEQVEYNQDLAALRVGLGETGFAEAWEAGQAMTLEQAIDLAESQPVSTRPASPPGPEIGPARQPSQREAAKVKYGGLTPKEREVAALVAQGKSNLEIANELFVGRKTVEAHVSRILSKLGFTSRAQIAAWAVAKDLAEAPPDPDTLAKEG